MIYPFSYINRSRDGNSWMRKCYIEEIPRVVFIFVSYMKTSVALVIETDETFVLFELYCCLSLKLVLFKVEFVIKNVVIAAKSSSK